MAMKQAVLGYHEEHNAHGIIFVRTRADARVLHSILQSGGRGAGCQPAYVRPA